MSWEQDFIAEVTKMSELHLLKWTELVQELGIDLIDLPQYTDIVKSNVDNLYKEMIEEIENMKETLADKILTMLKEAQDLCKELSIKMPEYGKDQLSLFQERKLLAENITEYKKMVEERTKELKSLLKRQNNLCKSLGCEPKHIKQSPLPSADEISQFENYLQKLDSERFVRTEKFLQTKAEILQIATELKVEPSLDFEKIVFSDDDTLFVVSDANMLQLDRYHASLVRQREEVKDEIQHLREQIEGLWTILEEDIQYRDQFRNTHIGNCLETLNNLKMELKKCEEKKKANIQAFTEKLREQLRRAWDKVHYTDSQKDEFKFLDSSIYTEDLLELHQRELERINKHYERNSKFFEKLTKYTSLWERMLELENRATNSDRYKNRGGQLLKEERERNDLSKKIPWLEQELLKLAEKYEEDHGEPLLVWGITIVEHIGKLHEKRDKEKKQKLSARKQQREVLLTPAKNTLGLFPSISTQSLRKTPTPVLPAKRKLLTPGFCEPKRTRLNKGKENRGVATEPPTLKVNGRSIRTSSERRSTAKKWRRLSKKLQTKIETMRDASVEYDAFQKDIEIKGTSRSTTIFGTANSSPLAALLPSTPSKVQPNNEQKSVHKTRSPHAASTSKFTAASPLKLIF